MQLLSQHVPGALGLALRKTLFPSLLGACGRNVVFGQNVVLRHPHKIRIGDNVVIDDNCLIDAKGDANRGITHRQRRLRRPQQHPVVQERRHRASPTARTSASTARCSPPAASPIGRDTLLAAYCYVIGGDHDPAAPRCRSRCKGGIVRRRDRRRRWLGAGAKILDGVTIGDRAIVGAGAVVRTGVAAAEIVAGVPARTIGSRERPSTD